MKVFSSATARKSKLFSLLLAAGFLSGTAIAVPQALAVELSSTTIEATAEAQATPPKTKPRQSTDNPGRAQKLKANTAQDQKKDDEKSKSEGFQENLKTAKDAYEKIGSEILDGNYGKALDGAANMAKDKMIEKAEDALKKKNETLYKAYKHGKDIKDDVMKGDYSAAWDKTKDAAYDEAKEFIEDKVMTKMIPGYGQLKGAWEVGYATGELVGQIPISADGKTVNDLAEDQMRDSFFGKQDSASSKKEAYNEVILALVKSVKKGEYKLPEYMTFSDAREIIQENMDGNRPPFEGFKAWAANELSDDDVVEPVAAVLAVSETLEKPVETPPKSKPAPVPEPVEDDPWAADPIPKKPAPANEVEPQVEPVEDIWAASEDNYNQLDDERYRLQQQLDAEKERDRAISDNQSYQKFAAAEAKREEEARIKAEKARKFREGMDALAQGLGQVAQQIQQAQQGGGAASSPAGSPQRSGKRAATPAEKAAAIYQMCVQRTGDQKGCRNLSSTGVKLDSDMSKGKIPMDFIRKTCRQDSDSEKNYNRCVKNRVAEMKQRMGQ